MESMQNCTVEEDTAVFFTLGFDDTWKYYWASDATHTLNFEELRISIAGVLQDNGQNLTSNQVLFWVQDSATSPRPGRNVVVGIYTAQNDSACPDFITSIVQEL